MWKRGLTNFKFKKFRKSVKFLYNLLLSENFNNVFTNISKLVKVNVKLTHQ